MQESEQDLLASAAKVSDAAQAAEAAQMDQGSSEPHSAEQQPMRPTTAPAGATSFRLRPQATLQRGLTRQRTTRQQQPVQGDNAPTEALWSSSDTVKSASASGTEPCEAGGSATANATSCSFVHRHTSSSQSSRSYGTRQLSFGSRIQAGSWTQEPGLLSVQDADCTDSSGTTYAEASSSGRACCDVAQDPASPAPQRSNFFQRSHARVNFAGTDSAPGRGRAAPSTQQQQRQSDTASEDCPSADASTMRMVQPSMISSAGATAASAGSDDETSSCSGSDHDSDLDVPVALWLSEFDAARHSKLSGTGALAARMASAGSRLKTDAFNSPMCGGRVAVSVAHLLQIRPPTEVARPKTAAAALGGGRREERRVHMARGV